jgi:hypothetical protein
VTQEPKPVKPDSVDADGIREVFADIVNMTARELERWLQTDESKSVGQERGESTGHKSGRRIVHLLKTKKADLSGSEFAHMRKVNGDVSRTAWRYSLMNWGHDPLK